MTAYVNQTCRCGPMLNQTRIIRLPLHYGPGVVSRTLKKIIQALVDSAINPAQVFNNLVTAPSNCSITGETTYVHLCVNSVVRNGLMVKG